MIKAIYKGTGVEESEYGKKGVLIFEDLSLDGSPLLPKYTFNTTKKFKEAKLKAGDVVSFDAEVDITDCVKILRPRNIKKEDISHLGKPYEHCINKFLKESRVLSKQDSTEEKIAFIRLSSYFTDDIDFWKFVNLPFRLNSLYYFLTEDGIKFLKDQKTKFDKSNFELDIERKEYILEKDKIGEDVIVDRKKQSLMGFMK